MLMDIQHIYQTTITFAAQKHNGQTIPNTNLPYLLHLSNVAMEIIFAAQHTPHFNVQLALPVALLHDTLEDTNTTEQELTQHFGQDISNAVKALTKSKTDSKEEAMQNSLNKIKQLSKEVWSVKLADRITNLQAPPSNWNKEKIGKYYLQAIEILTQLKGANHYLETRLATQIELYQQYL
jgi:guanosine-3',5'-bis(diphosphate) 3'-pyrophosphohydrolase